MLYFQGYRVNTSHATKIYKTYSIAVVKEHPYKLRDNRSLRIPKKAFPHRFVSLLLGDASLPITFMLQFCGYLIDQDLFEET